MRNLTKIIPHLVIGLFGAGLMHAAPAMANLTWKWSFKTEDTSQFGSGTFTTAKVTPTVSTWYPVLGIDGTYDRDGIAYTINGISTAFSADNKFQWDGTSNSPIILSVDGISFIAGSTAANMYTVLGPGPANATFSDFSGSDAKIVASSLMPLVPGPLPIFGVGLAYRWSRTLRRRTTKLG